MVGGRTWRFHCTNVRMCRFLTVSLSTKAPSSRIRVCLKTEIVFSVFEKKIRVHTLRSWMVFARPKENAIAIETGTSFDENMRINWYPSPWRHRFSWTSVSIHPHEYSKTASSKISTLESVLENTRFRWPFLPDTCKRQAKLEGKNPFSNKNLHVDGTKASLLFFMRFPEKNSNTPLSNNKKSFSSWHACRRTSYKAWNFHGIIR